MKMIHWLGVICLTVTVLAAGCSRPTEPSKSDTAKASVKAEGGSVSESLAKLSPEDRKLAEEQKYCAVITKNLLGSMGAPEKLIINGQPVFLCCDGCETRAKAHADRTLAKVQELKAANKSDTK